MTAITQTLWPAGEAVVSSDGQYRYVLNRRWSTGPVMAWIGLNPSTADADTDDPTVRRMCGFAHREGCGGICLLNLYALRSADPAALHSHADPVGPENDRWLAGLAVGGVEVPVVAAWGAHPFAASRAAQVRILLAKVPLVCLGLTRGGAPRHPLYVRADQPFADLIRQETP